MKKKVWKSIAVILAIAILVSGLAACGGGSSSAASESSSGQEVRKIVIALAPGYYPITYADENGNAAGYDVEVFKAIDELYPQYEFEYEIVEKETMNVGVQTGTYQVGINSMFKTPQREEIYLFPDVNMGYTAVGAIYREDLEHISSFQDIYDRGLTLHPTGASGGILNVINEWNENHPDAQLEIEALSAVDNNEALNAVRTGEYDTFIHLIPVINLWDEELLAGLQVSDPLAVIPTWPIINAEETQLRDDITAALKQLKEDGTLSKLSVDSFGYDVFSIAD